MERNFQRVRRCMSLSASSAGNFPRRSSSTTRRRLQRRCRVCRTSTPALGRSMCRPNSWSTRSCRCWGRFGHPDKSCSSTARYSAGTCRRHSSARPDLISALDKNYLDDNFCIKNSSSMYRKNNKMHSLPVDDDEGKEEESRREGQLQDPILSF